MQASKKMAFELKPVDLLFFTTGKRRCQVLRTFNNAKKNTVIITATVLATGRIVSKSVDQITLVKIYTS